MDTIFDYEIIDFHTHPFLCEDQILCMYQDTVTSMEIFLEDMKESNISHFAGSVIKRNKDEYTSFQQLKELNDTALRLRERFPQIYIPGFHIHPAFARESVREIERMKQEGVVLIGELVPYAMQWENYNDPRMKEIYECAQANGMIISFHTMSLDTIETTVASYPKLAFVAAHPGQRDQAEFHKNLLKKYDNYYLDLSGTGIFRYGAIRYLIEQTGKNHLLFGTDYPITNPYMYVHAVLGEHLDHIQNEMIFSQNAKELLKL